METEQKQKEPRTTGRKFINFVAITATISLIIVILYHTLGTPIERKLLLKWANENSNPTNPADMAPFIAAVNKMDKSEIATIFRFVYQYVKKNKNLDPTTPLGIKVNAVSTRYSIFQ